MRRNGDSPQPRFPLARRGYDRDAAEMREEAEAESRRTILGASGKPEELPEEEGAGEDEPGEADLEEFDELDLDELDDLDDDEVEEDELAEDDLDAEGDLGVAPDLETNGAEPVLGPGLQGPRFRPREPTPAEGE